jgi:orotidine-5'-phosphate decarboxylase
MDTVATPVPSQDNVKSKTAGTADDVRREEARARLIVALDLPSAGLAMEMVDQLQGVVQWFKVGMELYYAAGNGIVEHIRKRGFEVFLDLKLHDIPNTVAAAVRTLRASGAALLTVHAGGGEAMLRAAAEAASAPDSPQLLAVTVLTSMDAQQLAGVGVDDVPLGQVKRLAEMAKLCGISGIVCSPQEVLEVRGVMGPQGMLVIPGIRPTGGRADDQKRIATPGDALRNGASKLVVGRPITKAVDPAKAAEAILVEMAQAL